MTDFLSTYKLLTAHHTLTLAYVHTLPRDVAMRFTD